MTVSPRRILVTGGASGLGRGIATAFRDRGDEVFIGDVNADAATAVAAEIGATALTLDIGDESSVRAAAERLAADGGIDVLVNNAGIVAGGGTLQEVPVDVVDAALRVNVRGTFLMLRIFGALLADAGRGAIVNISSIGARQPTPDWGTTRRRRPRSTPSPAPRRSSSPPRASGSTRWRPAPCSRLSPRTSPRTRKPVRRGSPASRSAPSPRSTRSPRSCCSSRATPPATSPESPSPSTADSSWSDAGSIPLLPVPSEAPF